MTKEISKERKARVIQIYKYNAVCNFNNDHVPAQRQRYNYGSIIFYYVQGSTFFAVPFTMFILELYCNPTVKQILRASLGPHHRNTVCLHTGNVYFRASFKSLDLKNSSAIQDI